MSARDRLFMGERAQRFWGSGAGQVTFAGMVLGGAALLFLLIWVVT